MVTSSNLECSFFIPINRDPNLSDGLAHESSTWDELDDQLFRIYEGRTIAPGRYRGFYKDPDTGERVDDESYRFIVSMPEEKVESIRTLLRKACIWFRQKCIYLSVAGEVEFIRPEDNETK